VDGHALISAFQLLLQHPPETNTLHLSIDAFVVDNNDGGVHPVKGAGLLQCCTSRPSKTWRWSTEVHH